jgi:hypothetical protein
VQGYHLVELRSELVKYILRAKVKDKQSIEKLVWLIGRIDILSH